MSYIRKEWVTGDDISINDLNRIEEGIDNTANPFVITLTPTAQDFSGVMDKTCGEINEAYEAGKTIVFKIYKDKAGGYIISKNVNAIYGSGATALGFMADALIDGVGLITIYTGVNPPDDRTTYSTIIYPLTNA